MYDVVLNANRLKINEPLIVKLVGTATRSEVMKETLECTQTVYDVERVSDLEGSAQDTDHHRRHACVIIPLPLVDSNAVNGDDG